VKLLHSDNGDNRSGQQSEVASFSRVARRACHNPLTMTVFLDGCADSLTNRSVHGRDGPRLPATSEIARSVNESHSAATVFRNWELIRVEARLLLG
jgi:hypothetical protein